MTKLSRMQEEMKLYEEEVSKRMETWRTELNRQKNLKLDEMIKENEALQQRYFPMELHE